MTEFCQSLGVNREREPKQALPAETTVSMVTNTLWGRYSYDIAGLVIDCLKTIDNFRFQFWFKTIDYSFYDCLFRKNLNLFVVSIVCDRGIESGKPN